MLYDNRACSNSYYWHNLSNLAFFLIMISLLASILCSIFLLIKNKEKKDIKSNSLNIISCVGIYLIGTCMLIVKTINPIFGIVLVFVSSILLAYLRQNFAYLLLTFVVGLFLDNAFGIVTIRLCLFLLYVLAIYSVRKLPKKKKLINLIPLIICLVMFIGGVAISSYVSINRPEGYCWSSK